MAYVTFKFLWKDILKENSLNNETLKEISGSMHFLRISKGRLSTFS